MSPPHPASVESPRGDHPASAHGDARGDHDRGGHDHGHDHGDHAAEFRWRFWVALVLTVPVIAWAETLQHWLGDTAPAVPGSELIPPVLGTAVFASGGWPFLSGGWAELRARRPGMMLLVAMAVVVAFASSRATTLGVLELMDCGGRCRCL